MPELSPRRTLGTTPSLHGLEACTQSTSTGSRSLRPTQASQVIHFAEITREAWYLATTKTPWGGGSVAAKVLQWSKMSLPSTAARGRRGKSRRARARAPLTWATQSCTLSGLAPLAPTILGTGTRRQFPPLGRGGSRLLRLLTTSSPLPLLCCRHSSRLKRGSSRNQSAARDAGYRLQVSWGNLSLIYL